jgi:heme-binding protein
MAPATVRRVMFGAFAGGLLAFGSAAIIIPVATAEPAPAVAEVAPAQQAAWSPTV